MFKKNIDTTNVYERISKSELFAYMNSSIPSLPEKDRLHRALLRNVDLFKTVRHGKTVVLGSDAAKKYIEEERKTNLLHFIVWAIFVAVGAALFVFIANTIGKHPVISFSDVVLLILMTSAEVFVVFKLMQTFFTKSLLTISEEHIDRGINPDYFEIDFVVGDKMSYNSFVDNNSLVIVRTQHT
jgi:hypothetical protein